MEAQGLDPAAWADRLQPAMKRIALATLRCAQDMVSVRKGSFELYGFDFLIDSCLDVWLLEVNCSPTLEASTPITERMCADLQVRRLVGGRV